MPGDSRSCFQFRCYQDLMFSTTCRMNFWFHSISSHTTQIFFYAAVVWLLGSCFYSLRSTFSEVIEMEIICGLLSPLVSFVLLTECYRLLIAFRLLFFRLLLSTGRLMTFFETNFPIQVQKRTVTFRTRLFGASRTMVVPTPRVSLAALFVHRFLEFSTHWSLQWRGMSPRRWCGLLSATFHYPTPDFLKVRSLSDLHKRSKLPRRIIDEVEPTRFLHRRGFSLTNRTNTVCSTTETWQPYICTIAPPARTTSRTLQGIVLALIHTTNGQIKNIFISWPSPHPGSN